MSVPTVRNGSPDATGGVDLSALPVAAFRTDLAGRYLAVNDHWTALTGISAEAALGTGWIGALHPDDVDDVLAAWHDAIFTQSSVPLEYRLQRSSSDPIWVLSRATPSPRGDPTGYVGVVVDISPRVAVEQQVRRDHAELAEAREQFATVLRSLEELVYTSELRPDGTSELVFVGPGVQRLLGGELAPHDDPFEGWLRAVHPEDRARVIGAVRNPFAHDGQSREYRVCGLDGITRWICARTRVRHSADGRVLVDGVATDVTDRHARDAEREQFGALATACGDLIAITTIDLRLTYLNPAGRRLLGLPADAQLDLRLADACAPRTMRELYGHAVAAARQTGEWRGEGRLCNLHDGTLIEVEIALLLLRDPTTREPTGFATIQRDVSEQRRLAGRLRAAEGQLRTLVDSIGEVVYEVVAVPNGLRTVFISRALEQLLGRSIAEDEDGLAAFDASIHSEDRAAAQARAVRIRNGFPDSSEVRIVRGDGDIRTVSVSARPRRHRDGQLTISGVIADITDAGAARTLPTVLTPAIRPLTPPSDSGLTTRQTEILDLLGQGYNAPQIAERLTLSVSTVRNHSHAILRALNVQTRAAALERARTLGIIWAPPHGDADPRDRRAALSRTGIRAQ